MPRPITCAFRERVRRGTRGAIAAVIAAETGPAVMYIRRRLISLVGLSLLPVPTARGVDESSSRR